MYCVDVGGVFYKCQLDPIGWWCSGFQILGWTKSSFVFFITCYGKTQMNLGNPLFCLDVYFISYVSFSFTSCWQWGVEVPKYGICLLFLLALPVFVSLFCNYVVWYIHIWEQYFFLVSWFFYLMIKWYSVPALKSTISNT